jgi:hypothetical protein
MRMTEEKIIKNKINKKGCNNYFSLSLSKKIKWFKFVTKRRQIKHV